MNKNKKKAIMLAIIVSLSSSSLIGCGKTKINKTDIVIEWKNNDVISGKVPYDDIKDNIKVVILEQNGTIEPFLIVRNISKSNVRYGSGQTTLSYINFKNGKTIIKYKWNNQNANIETDDIDETLEGKSIKILEENNLYDYLSNYSEIKDEFDTTELIDIYNNDIEPELIKYIEEKYNYTKKLQ